MGFEECVNRKFTVVFPGAANICNHESCWMQEASLRLSFLAVVMMLLISQNLEK